eukprot:198370-Pelagomonas_calceolata.AAC.6
MSLGRCHHDMRAGLHCRDLLDRLMIGARAPTMVPELDATLTAKGCDAALRTLPVALTNKRRREAQKEFGAESCSMAKQTKGRGRLGRLRSFCWAKRCGLVLENRRERDAQNELGAEACFCLAQKMSWRRKSQRKAQTQHSTHTGIHTPEYI